MKSNKNNYRYKMRSSVTGRFIPRNSIINGRLYEYRGTVVRARKSCNNGKRLVSFHNQLFGFVNDSELLPIQKQRVEEYLTYANNK